MKALTVRQPWAWAIFHGKDVENRSKWKYRFTGILTIHAGQQLAGQDAWAEVQRLSTDTLPQFGLPREPTECAFGALIGCVDLLEPHWWEDCLKPDGSLCSPWAQRDQHHLPLRHPRKFLEPLECPGALGLWNAPTGTLHAVRQVL